VGRRKDQGGVTVNGVYFLVGILAFKSLENQDR
jgi:hypothetical protein